MGETDYPANTEAEDLNCGETPAFRDIDVPGIGVRAALGDDEPVGSGFGSGIRNRLTEKADGWRRRAGNAAGGARRIGSVVAVRLNRSANHIQSGAASVIKLLVRQTDLLLGDLRRMRASRSKVIDAAANQLRTSARNAEIATSAVAARTATRISRDTKLWAHAARANGVRVVHAMQSRVSLLPSATEAVRKRYQSTQLWLRQRAAAVKSRVQAAANYNLRIRVSYQSHGGPGPVALSSDTHAGGAHDKSVTFEISMGMQRSA